ncbi:MAG: OmpA family protein [Planctomycetota bacterium]
MLSRLGLVTLGMLLVVPAGCISPEAHRQLQTANDALQRNIADLERYHKELEARNGMLEEEVEKLGRNAVEADYLRQRKAELDRLIKQFETGGTHAVPGVKVISTAEGVGFQVQGEVLFDSGRAQVTKSGQDVLRQLLPTLRDHQAQFRIDGHADPDPIRHSEWKTNLRLSAERAMAVFHFLEENGISPTRMHIGAFGEHRPSAIGTDETSKRQNRRVEIMMLRQ